MVGPERPAWSVHSRRSTEVAATQSPGSVSDAGAVRPAASTSSTSDWSGEAAARNSQGYGWPVTAVAVRDGTVELSATAPDAASLGTVVVPAAAVASSPRPAQALVTRPRPANLATRL